MRIRISTLRGHWRRAARRTKTRARRWRRPKSISTTAGRDPDKDWWEALKQ